VSEEDRQKRVGKRERGGEGGGREHQLQPETQSQWGALKYLQSHPSEQKINKTLVKKGRKRLGSRKRENKKYDETPSKLLALFLNECFHYHFFGSGG